MSILSHILSGWTLLLAVLLYSFYKWSTATFNFFKNKNVPFIKPIPFFGNIGHMFFQTESVFDTTRRMYMEYDDKKLYGAFFFREPHLVVKDPEILKQITVKDFDHFVNHRSTLEEQDAPLFVNSLFFLKDQKWKDMRSTLSPAFTGSKMRLMFQLIEETCQTLIEYMNTEATKGPLIVELKEFVTHYTNDVIATTAFGLNVNSLKDKTNEFYTMGKDVTNFRGWVLVKFFIFSTMRKVMNFLRIQLFNRKYTDYFNILVLDTMKYRTDHNIFRPDMIQLLMEARKTKLKGSSDNYDATNAGITGEKMSTKSHNREWTDNEIVAQCFLFFFAGFETVSALMCFCAHELMENPDIQKRLFKEIEEVKRDLNGKPLTYEVLQKMKYLDMVISETLRKCPPVIGVDRVCTKPYTIVDNTSGITVQMDKSDLINIPVAGIHRDPKYYPDPERFDPERFNDENKGNINPIIYLPFGVGPRICIASRLALMESKAFIFHLLSEFSFEVSAKSTIPIKLSAAGINMMAKDGFWIHLKPRK